MKGGSGFSLPPPKPLLVPTMGPGWLPLGQSPKEHMTANQHIAWTASWHLKAWFMLSGWYVLITVNYNCLEFLTSLPTLRPLMYLHWAYFTHPTAAAALCKSRPSEQHKHTLLRKADPCSALKQTQRSTAIAQRWARAEPPQQSTHPQHLLPSHLAAGAEPCRVTTEFSKMYSLLFFCCYYLLQHSLGSQY